MAAWLHVLVLPTLVLREEQTAGVAKVLQQDQQPRIIALYLVPVTNSRFVEEVLIRISMP
jgi:hypothetical protein